jgi:hypothetical protein
MSTPTNPYWQPPRHPRAGLAIAVALVAAWLGAIGVAIATGDHDDGNRTTTTDVRTSAQT